MINQIIGEVSADAPVDLAILIDRSSGMGRSWFYRYEKTFAQSLIHQYVNLHPDYVRLAVVTFGKDVSTPINYISSPSDDNLKVKLFFAPDPAWDDVVYYTDPERAGATDLNMGLTRVQSILEDGAALRPGVQQIIVAISDGNYNSEAEDPLTVLSQLKPTVKIYAIGLGPWLQVGNIREVATNASYYSPYDDSGSSDGGDVESWMDLLDEMPRATTESRCTFDL